MELNDLFSRSNSVEVGSGFDRVIGWGDPAKTQLREAELKTHPQFKGLGISF